MVDTLNKYIDLVKVVKVINSCKDIEQKEVAARYYELFLIKYNYDISIEYKLAIEKLLTIPIIGD